MTDFFGKEFKYYYWCVYKSLHARGYCCSAAAGCGGGGIAVSSQSIAKRKRKKRLVEVA